MFRSLPATRPSCLENESCGVGAGSSGFNCIAYDESRGSFGFQVIIKKPQFSSAKEMFHAVKKCRAAGNENVILCERGNVFGYNNLVVDTLNFQILKQEGNPVFFDVTHSLQQPGMLEKSTGGRGQYVYELAKAGISQNIAGLFIETHPEPSEAKCDGPCALKLADLDNFMKRVIALDDFVKNI